jgi:hypothetical protein
MKHRPHPLPSAVRIARRPRPIVGCLSAARAPRDLRLGGGHREGPPIVATPRLILSGAGRGVFPCAARSIEVALMPDRRAHPCGLRCHGDNGDHPYRRGADPRPPRTRGTSGGVPHRDDLEAISLDRGARPPGHRRGGGDRRLARPRDSPLLRPLDPPRRGDAPQAHLRHRRPGVGVGADPRVRDVPEDAGGN